MTLEALIESGFKASVIYADPPWRFVTRSPKGMGRSADRHYPTLDLTTIRGLPVAELADTPCALFLWVTWPFVFQAESVIKAWGFTYSTVGFVWAKLTADQRKLAIGTGYTTRANTEVCLYARRGFPKRLRKDVEQLIVAPRHKHSQKPLEARLRIEALFGGPYLELFAPAPVAGWTSWGLDFTTTLPAGAMLYSSSSPEGATPMSQHPDPNKPGENPPPPPPAEPPPTTPPEQQPPAS